MVLAICQEELFHEGQSQGVHGCQRFFFVLFCCFLFCNAISAGTKYIENLIALDKLFILRAVNGTGDALSL